MESLPAKGTAPPGFRADSNSNGSYSNHLFDLRSSLSSSVKVPQTPPRNGGVNLRSRKGMEFEGKSFAKIVKGDNGYVLEDVPHLTDYIDDLPVGSACSCSFLELRLLWNLFPSLPLFISLAWRG